MRRTFIAGATAALLVGCIMAPASAEEAADPADVIAPAAEAEAPAEPAAPAEVAEPEVTEPAAPAEVVEPEVTEPAAPAEVVEPEAPAEVVEPEVTEPEAPAEVTEPEVTEPEAPAEVTEPEVTDPAAAEPEPAAPAAEPAAPAAPAAEPAAPAAPAPAAPAAPAPAAAPAPQPAAAPADPKDGELIDISDRVGVDPALLHGAVILGVTRDGCLLTITVKIEVDGSYTLQVWDDGELIGELPASGKAGDVRVLQYLMTANVGTLYRGYDFVIVNANGDTVAHYDWDFEGSANVMAECHEKAKCGGDTSGTAAGEPVAMTEPAEGVEPAAEPAAEPVPPLPRWRRPSPLRPPSRPSLRLRPPLPRWRRPSPRLRLRPPRRRRLPSWPTRVRRPWSSAWCPRSSWPGEPSSCAPRAVAAPEARAARATST